MTSRTSLLPDKAATRSPRAVRRVALAVLACASLSGALSGCALLIGGAAVGSALVYSDRRTSGAQLEDQASN